MSRQSNGLPKITDTDKKAQQCKYGRIDWLKIKTCRQTNDSYHTVKNWLVIYQLTVETRQIRQRKKLRCHFFWPMNKMCRQVNDSSRHPKNIYWLKNIMCHYLSDSSNTTINYEVVVKCQHSRVREILIMKKACRRQAALWPDHAYKKAALENAAVTADRPTRPLTVNFVLTSRKRKTPQFFLDEPEALSKGWDRYHSN